MSENKACHITSIGGQAVIEGVMMRGVKEIAIAVRKPDGDIIVEKKPVSSITSKFKFLKIPIIRGVVSFIESLVVGTSALMFSAEFYDIEDEEDKKKKAQMTEEELEELKKKESKAMNWAIYSSVVIALFLGIVLFMMLPTVITGFVKNYVTNPVLFSLIEGIIRICIFLIYISLVAKMKDIKRVFEYHGAEHKTIFCYENGEELTVENVKKYGRLHPRCGTSFLLIVMVVSIVLFSFISVDNMIMRIVTRLLLLPVVAGVSYEIIKFAGRSKSKFMKIVSYPGMLLQKLTTNEPDESQIEVAIESLKAVLTGNIEDDRW